MKGKSHFSNKTCQKTNPGARPVVFLAPPAARAGAWDGQALIFSDLSFGNVFAHKFADRRWCQARNANYHGHVPDLLCSSGAATDAVAGVAALFCVWIARGVAAGAVVAGVAGVAVGVAAGATGAAAAAAAIIIVILIMLLLLVLRLSGILTMNVYSYYSYHNCSVILILVICKAH